MFLFVFPATAALDSASSGASRPVLAVPVQRKLPGARYHSGNVVARRDMKGVGKKLTECKWLAAGNGNEMR